MAEPRLSLCMIVRDEADMLPVFLQRAAGLWDELCVVDTGSADATPELLERAGARLARVAWQDDFSKARNESLRMATGDWVLFLDADERASVELVAQVRALLSDRTAGAATVAMRNRMPHGHLREAPLLRMFRNDPSIRFRHPIHEDVSESVAAYLGRSGRRLVHLSGRVEHVGYVRSVAAARDKRNRDRRLLSACLHSDPADLYSCFKLMELARFWNDRALWQPTAEETLRRLEGPPGDVLGGLHYAGELVALLAEGLYPGRPQQALSLLNRFAQPGSAAFRLSRGALCEQLGDPSRARDDFQACLRMDAARDEQLIRVRPLLGLTRLAIMAGALDQAEGLAERALATNPRDPEALFAVVSLARMQGGRGALDRFAEAHRQAHGELAELHLALGDDALAAGESHRAVAELCRAVELDPADDRTALRLAQALLADGQVDAAAEAAGQLVQRLPDAAMGVLVCDLLRGRDSDIQVELDLAALDQALRAWVDALRQSRKRELVEALRRTAPAVRHVFPWLPTYLAA